MEHQMRLYEKPYITKLLISLWAIIFILDISVFTKSVNIGDWFIHIFWNSHGNLNDILALIPDNVINHEYWRILSYSFIHFGLLHVIGNILLVSFIGNILESRISAVDFIFPVIVGNIIAGVVLMSVSDNTAYICGSSPGIYALYGVFVSNIYFRKIKATEYMSVKYRNIIIAVLLLANFLGIDTLLIHAVGFITGLFIGFVQTRLKHTFELI